MACAPCQRLIDRSTSKELVNSGSSFFLIQVAAVVVFSSDNVIVSHYLGAAVVTPYSVTWRLVGLAAVLQSLIFPALWPAYAEAYAKRDYGWIRRTFSLTMKGTVMLNLCCVAGLVVFGRVLIRWWAGNAAVPTFSLLLAMGLWALISGFMSVESCLLAALNRTREQAFLSMIAAGLNIALSIALVRHIGAVGVIGGTILSYVFVLVIPQSMIVRSLFKGELAAEGRAFRRSLFALRQNKVSLQLARDSKFRCSQPWRERLSRAVYSEAWLQRSPDISARALKAKSGLFILPGRDWWRVLRQS